MTRRAAQASCLTSAGAGDRGAVLTHVCPRSSLSLSRAGLKEANDIVLYLKPLRVLLEEMEQADFPAVRGPPGRGWPWVPESRGAGGWCWAVIRCVGWGGPVPWFWSPLLEPSDDVTKRTAGPSPPAPRSHHQGAVYHLLHLGHLGALQHALQGHRHPAGVLQPRHRDGSPPPRPLAAFPLPCWGPLSLAGPFSFCPHCQAV